MEEIKNVNDLSTFKRAFNEMVVKSGRSWNESLGYRIYDSKLKEYSREEVVKIINSSSLQA